MNMKMTKERAAIPYLVMVVFFYLADCFIAHPTHPDVHWIASGVYSGGPFGFLATEAVVVAGIVHCAKQGS
jgi:hypothetical protein